MNFDDTAAVKAKQPTGVIDVRIKLAIAVGSVYGTDTEEISDKDLGLPLGNVISSLRTPLQTQRTGVAARIT